MGRCVAMINQMGVGFSPSICFSIMGGFLSHQKKRCHFLIFFERKPFRLFGGQNLRTFHHMFCPKSPRGATFQLGPWGIFPTCPNISGNRRKSMYIQLQYDIITIWYTSDVCRCDNKLVSLIGTDRHTCLLFDQFVYVDLCYIQMKRIYFMKLGRMNISHTIYSLTSVHGRGVACVS